MDTGKLSILGLEPPPEQQAIRAKCFHPSGEFVEFPMRDVETSIPERFEKIARLYPDRLAVKAGIRSLTYDELNRAANRVAHAIQEKCGDEISPILVLADHGTPGIISCLGVLKAGKIMVAVDPLFPVHRLTFMADDSKAAAILTGTDNLKLATNLATRDRSIINVDALANDISAENIGLRRSPFDPAIIRYTSGSTGRPKGVIRSHRRNLFTYMLSTNCGHMCPEDRVIILRPLGFSATDTLTGLLSGAAVVPFDIRGQALLSLGKFLRTEEITYFIATPSIFRYFAQELDDREEFPQLRMIKLGGEPLFKADVEQYKRHFSPNCLLLNQLSANEMGPICQYWITKQTEINTSLVPVGYPVEGKKVLLLDDEQKEVDVNQIGEIAVASGYLSSGYWNKSELTDDKFSASKDSSDERLYVSGDLGRMLPDGCLIYLGRKDDQVKIRGAKVEIGEIQAVLSEHPQIRHSAVLAFDRTNGDKYLTAYVVSRCHPAPTVTDLNDYLKKKLPDYMIPSAFVFLESLPLTNGKLDRKALPKPDDRRPELSTPYVSPRSELEEKLVQVWKEVLAVRPIGVDDNFFELGGNSLTATRVVSRLLRAFQLEIPLQSLFQSPTVAEMAKVIAATRGKRRSQEEIERILSSVEEVEEMSEEEAKQCVENAATQNTTPVLKV